MYMWGAEGEAVVDEGGVDHHAVLRSLQKVTKVTKMAVTASHAVAGRILVKNKNLPRTEPPLGEKC